MVNSFLLYLRLTVKIFQFLRLSAKFLAVLRLSVNPIETLFIGFRRAHSLQKHFLISLEFSLVENYNTRFIKKFSQLNSDMQSYRCKDFSLKQVSGLMGGPDPPDPPPGSATALVPFDILSTAFGINSNTPIASYRCTF